MKKLIATLILVLCPLIAEAGLWKHLYPTWNDTLTPALAARVGATAPNFSVFRGGIYALEFVGTPGTNDEVHFGIQFPHSYKENSTIDFHFHVATAVTGTTGNNAAEFCVEYEWVPVGGLFSATTTTACKVFTVTTPFMHELWEITDINGVAFGTGVSSIFIGRLYRNKTGGADNYTGSVFVHSIDLHFIQDTSGSWQEYSK